jgi:hypothetical protein
MRARAAAGLPLAVPGDATECVRGLTRPVRGEPAWAGGEPRVYRVVFDRGGVRVVG